MSELNEVDLLFLCGSFSKNSLFDIVRQMNKFLYHLYVLQTDYVM